MDLRHIENAVIDQAILHVLDTGGDAPILAAEVLQIQDEEIYTFIASHIVKSLGDDAAFKAKYIGETAMISRMSKLLNTDSFIEGSVELANRMFDYLTKHKEPSCDLLVVKFHTGNIDACGVLKLDFQKSYMHELEYQDPSFKVNLVAQEIALPSERQKVLQCAFAKAYQADAEYDLIALNKKRSSDEEEQSRFLKAYLNAQREFDYKDKTKTLKRELERWTQKHLKEDFETAEELRRSLDDKLRYNAVIATEELAEAALSHDGDAKLSLLTKLEQSGIDSEEKFEVDKRYVAKKMKSKTVVTDTGFTIKADYELFDDDGFIQVKRNGDGTVDYIIKGVRHIKSR